MGDFNVTMPNYFYYPSDTQFPLSADAKLRLRCTNGRALASTAPGYVTGGYLDITCDSSSEWVEPDEWPPETDCENGAQCDPSTIGIPSHLSVASPATALVDSGNIMVLECNDTSKDLRLAVRPFEMECYNGNFMDSPKASGFPNSTQCVTPVQCPLSSLPTVNPPEYMNTTADKSSTIDHGDSVEFFCTDSKRIDPEVDTDGNNVIKVYCDVGILQLEHDWPTEMQCRSVCDSFTLPAGKGFSALPGSIDVMERDHLTLTCDDPTHYVNDKWTMKTYDLECLEDKTFDAPATDADWPQCQERPKCSTPPDAPPAADMEPVNATVTPDVTQYVTYTCIDPKEVTDSGRTIDVQCVKPQLNVDPYYDFPEQWGDKEMQCRKPNPCSPPPDAPEKSGLIISEPPASGYFEYETAKYTCENPAHVIYVDAMPTSDTEFEALCLPPGKFEKVKNWPYCDVPNAPQCSNYPQVPEGVDASIVEAKPVYRDGAVYYKCNGADMTTNIGEIVEVI